MLQLEVKHREKHQLHRSTASDNRLASLKIVDVDESTIQPLKREQ